MLASKLSGISGSHKSRHPSLRLKPGNPFVAKQRKMNRPKKLHTDVLASAEVDEKAMRCVDAKVIRQEAKREVNASHIRSFFGIPRRLTEAELLAQHEKLLEKSISELLLEEDPVTIPSLRRQRVLDEDSFDDICQTYLHPGPNDLHKSSEFELNE